MVTRFVVLVAPLALASTGTAPAPAGAQDGPIKVGLWCRSPAPPRSSARTC